MFFSDLRPLSVNVSPPSGIFPHSVFVRRRRHAAFFDRRRYGMPEQQLRIRPDAASRASVCRRRIRQSLVAHLTHLWGMRRIGKSESGIMALHGYGRGWNVVRSSVCSQGRNFFVAMTVSASWRRLDPDDSLLLFVPCAETTESDQSVDENNACQEQCEHEEDV